jgi:hypothetical protein
MWGGRWRARLAAVAVVGLVWGAGPWVGEPEAKPPARKPADVFRQRIILSDSSFPPRFADDEAFVKYMKKVDQKEFWQVGEGGPWRVHYMAFFKEPLAQRNYLVQFFDTTDGQPVLITQNATRATKDGMRIMAGDYDLESALFSPNRRILMLVIPAIGEAALAEVEFVLRPYDPAQVAEMERRRQESKREAAQPDKPKGDQPQWSPPDW